MGTILAQFDLAEKTDFSLLTSTGGSSVGPAILFVLFFLCVAAIPILFFLRFLFQRRAHGRHGGFTLSILQITLPKFRREEDVKKETTADQVRQGIAVAEGFFSTVGGLKVQRGFKAWLFGRSDEMSFEIVARGGLIFFFVAVPKVLQDHIEQQISSAYPDAHIEEVEDYNIFSPLQWLF